jgi:hypothetical protein
VVAVRYRRSSNAGATWTASAVLSGPSADFVYGAAIASRGAALDAAWIETTGDHIALVYRRSTNGGATWLAPIELTTGTLAAADVVGMVELPAVGSTATPPDEEVAAETTIATSGGPTGAEATHRAERTAPGRRGRAASGASPSYPRVVRDSANRVFVTWTDDVTGKINVRRSLDGGATFLAAVVLGTTTNQPYAAGSFDAFPSLAAGTSIAYVAYYATPSSLKLRRTTDGGATWKTAVTISSSANGYLPDVTATGSSAIVGYAVFTSSSQYTAIRRTTDKGASWKTAVKLTPSTGAVSFQANVAYGGGRWRAIYERCLTTKCSASAVYYRGSTDGTTWTTAQRISTSTRAYASPTGLAYSDRVGAMYADWAPAVLDSDVFFRAGS